MFTSPHRNTLSNHEPHRPAESRESALAHATYTAAFDREDGAAAQYEAPLRRS